MDIKTIYPTHELLKKHIQFYYFFSTEDPGFESSYYAFPHMATPLNIHRRADCIIDDRSIQVFGSDQNPYITILQGKYEEPLFIKLSGKLDKVTIIFSPLGLNHFIREPIGSVSTHHSQVFTSWNDKPEYTLMLQQFFATDVLEERAAVLETFLLSQYQPVADYGRMQGILLQLADFDSEPSVADIAAANHMSEKTLNRMFRRHIALSPVAYRKIARFRHSMSNKLYSDQLSSLTQIGYESNYYDQSYFSRIYKHMTGDNPSAFFNSIQKLGNEQVIFKFIRDMD